MTLEEFIAHVRDVIERLRAMKARVSGEDVTTLRQGEELLDELLTHYEGRWL